MAGSGLEEAGAICCGSNSVTHMLSGKAISCALRGFFLADGALSVFLLENLMPDADAVADPWGGVKGVIASPRGLAKLVTRHNCWASNHTETNSSRDFALDPLIVLLRPTSRWGGCWLPNPQ